MTPKVTPGIAADAFKIVSPAPNAYRFAYGYNLVAADGVPALAVHPRHRAAR